MEGDTPAWLGKILFLWSGFGFAGLWKQLSQWWLSGCLQGRDMILGTAPISQQRRGRAWGLQTM